MAKVRHYLPTCSLTVALAACASSPPEGLAPSADFAKCLQLIDERYLGEIDPIGLYARALEVLREDYSLSLSSPDPSLFRVRCGRYEVEIPSHPTSRAELLKTERDMAELLEAGCPARGTARRGRPAYAFAHAYIESLDEGSEYLISEVLERQIAALAGPGMIGITVGEHDGKSLIKEVLPYSPAIGSHLKPGAQLLAIDGTPTDGLSVIEIAQLLHGEIGSPVEIRFSTSTGRPQSAILKRALVAQQAVGPAERLPGGGAYIRLRSFREDSPTRLGRELLAAESARFLILDLRGNPGGLIAAVVDSADLLLPLGVAVGGVQARHPEEERQFWSTHPPLAEFGPIVVLVDEETASGAEMFAEALRDAGIANLAGRSTAGRDSVQTVFPLSNGAGLKLTTGNLVVGRATEIPEGGLTPDFDHDDAGGIMPPHSDPLVGAVVDWLRSPMEPRR